MAKRKGVATNRNPSPATRFGAGVSGNPIGKTSEQRATEIRNAWIATQIQGQMLEELADVIAERKGAALARIDTPTLKLIKDAQDRGLGTPQASVSISNPDGSLKPEPVAGMVKELLQAIHAKPDAG